MASEVVDILVVEDDPSDLELMRRALTKSGVTRHVHFARDGQEALDFMFRTGAYAGAKRSGEPKCIFLDLKLPVMGGLEVLDRLRRDPRTASIPVVVMTSSREASDVAESYRHYGNSYVVKPVAFDEYAETIAHVARYWVRFNVPPD